MLRDIPDPSRKQYGWNSAAEVDRAFEQAVKSMKPPYIEPIDYRKRCVVTVIHGDTGFNRMIYGVTAAEYNAAIGLDSARDMAESYGRKR